MKLEKLQFVVEDRVGIITMNYMKNLNAIDDQMADELMYVVDTCENDPNVKVVVLKGMPKAFSAGGDIGYFYNLIQQGGEVNMDSLISKVGNVTDGLKRMSKLVISSVSGAAAGAGVSLAFSGDFVVCADNAKFIMAFVNLGLVPDTGGTYLFVKSLGIQKAMELCVTGRPMKAQEAKDAGMVYDVVPAEELDDTVMKLAKKFASGPLLSYKNIKKQIYQAGLADYKKYLDECEIPTQRECAASSIMFGDWHGEFAADEIIDGMLEKGIKDIDAIAVSAGMADQGVGKLIKDHRVKSLITTHIGLNPIAKDQMFAGELAIEFSPQGTFAERIRCGGAGLGGCLTPTGLGTEVEEGKQKLTIDGKEYLLELPLRADVALIKATKADTAGNISFRMNSRATNSTMAMAADTVIVEVEEIVEVGELGPEEIDVPAPVIDMIYERTGEKRPMCPMWQRAKAKAEGGQ